MANVPFWGIEDDAIYDQIVYADEPWDLCILGKDKLPGIAEVKVSGGGIKLEAQKAKGRDGAALIEGGIRPYQVEISVKIWTPAQLRAFLKVVPKIQRRSGKLDFNDAKKRTASSAQVQATEKAALTIIHPATQAVGVAAVVVTNVGSFEPATEYGARVVKITATQYIPPPPVSAKATRKIAGVKKEPLHKAFTESTRPANLPRKPSLTDAGPRGAG